MNWLNKILRKLIVNWSLEAKGSPFQGFQNVLKQAADCGKVGGCENQQQRNYTDYIDSD